jgi:hypothetical protein
MSLSDLMQDLRREQKTSKRELARMENGTDDEKRTVAILYATKRDNPGGDRASLLRMAPEAEFIAAKSLSALSGSEAELFRIVKSANPGSLPGDLLISFFLAIIDGRHDELADEPNEYRMKESESLKRIAALMRSKNPKATSAELMITFCKIGMLLEAVESDDADEVEDILQSQHCQVPLDALGPDGATALHRAARGGHTNAMAALLTAGASKSAKNDEGQTPKDVAEQYGHAEAYADAVKAAVGFVSFLYLSRIRRLLLTPVTAPAPYPRNS